MCQRLCSYEMEGYVPSLNGCSFGDNKLCAKVVYL